MAGKSGKRLFPPDIAVDEWRTAFMEHYRADRHYKNAVACDLRPRWQVLVRSGQIGAVAAFRDCRWSADAEAVKYALAVERFVHDTLRLRHNGNAPEWACDFVHNDASAGPYGRIDHGTGALIGAVEGVALKVEVDMTGATVRLVREYGEVTGPDHTIVPREEELKRRNVHGSEMFGFDNFRGIHEAAQELLQGWTDEIQKGWKAEYPSEYLGARPARLDHQRELFGYLFQKEPIAGDDAKRKRLNKAARDLGLDFPVGKKQAPK